MHAICRRTLPLATFMIFAVHSFCTASAQADQPAAVKKMPKADMVITEKSNGKTVKAKVGEVLEIRLKGDRAMTGWGGGVPNYVGEKNKPRVLERGDTAFEDDLEAEDSAIGTYIFHVKAYEAGEIELTFRYIYPDGHGYELMPRLATQVVRQFKVVVNVE